MNTRALFFVLSLLAVITTTSAIVGSYKPIPDLHDPHVQEIAKYAVSEHNKHTSAARLLEYVEIVKGESQVVAGIMYRLVISAKDVVPLTISWPLFMKSHGHTTLASLLSAPLIN
ncbi:hypothetical protein RND81_06G142200 [Saponaria officinalis]|uniref:Cystatin domain-containing protein n=1 Tax=Saponaria officinalis TaxID=3572 RepID=A0AAW1KBD0_SAPOF